MLVNRLDIYDQGRELQRYYRDIAQTLQRYHLRPKLHQLSGLRFEDLQTLK